MSVVDPNNPTKTKTKEQLSAEAAAANQQGVAAQPEVLDDTPLAVQKRREAEQAKLQQQQNQNLTEGNKGK
jgi:hypothetical protein